MPWLLVDSVTRIAPPALAIDGADSVATTRSGPMRIEDDRMLLSSLVSTNVPGPSALATT
jgi:hypothetical protein